MPWTYIKLQPLCANKQKKNLMSPKKVIYPILNHPQDRSIPAPHKCLHDFSNPGIT